MSNDTSDTPTIQIPLSGGRSTIVSIEDSDLSQLSWCVSRGRSNSYVALYSKQDRYLMHRLILSRVLNRKLLTHDIVDHINGDTLDNRRENLRLASYSQNSCNRGKPSHNTSGYKGVQWIANRGKWGAYIAFNRKRIFLGLYDDINIAMQIYNYAAIDLHGEFAYLNTLKE